MKLEYNKRKGKYFFQLTTGEYGPFHSYAAFERALVKITRHINLIRSNGRKQWTKKS